MEKGIQSLVHNEFKSGMAAGFVKGTPSTIDLFVSRSNVGHASVLIEDFKKN